MDLDILWTEQQFNFMQERRSILVTSVHGLHSVPARQPLWTVLMDLAREGDWQIMASTRRLQCVVYFIFLFYFIFLIYIEYLNLCPIIFDD